MPVCSHPDAALLARCKFPAPGSAVTCAVSGGPDSTALLALAVAADLQVVAIHVDHGLRRGSAAEADVVRDSAERLGASFRSVSVTVARGPNLEARCREARRRALPPAAMTGHTADDQAETVLLNLMRGSATAGLAAMTPGPVHPILALRRSETRALCDALGLPTVDDPTNDDRRFLRNRVRHELLPALCAAAGRDLVPVLCRQADLLREDDDLLDELSVAVDPTDARSLRAAPTPLARRAVRRWLAAHLEGYPPDSAAVERVLSVARGEVAACHVTGGIEVRRSSGRLRLTYLPVT